MKLQEDFKSVRRQYGIQRARLTAPIGWDARGGFREYIADYQAVVRRLRWLRFCIEMRDAILADLARAFALIGALRNERPRLTWAGLLDVEQVRRAETRLSESGVSFNELLKPFQNL